MYELDTEIGSWRRRAERGSTLSPRELDELEDHLRASIDLELGRNRALPPDRALAIAREALGAPKPLSKEFARAGRPTWRHLLLAGWAMYATSFLLPVFGPPALLPFWSASGYEWLRQAVAIGWIVALIPNLAMPMTFPALWCFWRSGVRWLTWAVGALGVSALGFGVASLFDRPTMTINDEFIGHAYFGLGYWAWSAAYVLVGAALHLRNRERASVRPKKRAGNRDWRQPAVHALGGHR